MFLSEKVPNVATRTELLWITVFATTEGLQEYKVIKMCLNKRRSQSATGTSSWFNGLGRKNAQPTAEDSCKRQNRCFHSNVDAASASYCPELC